MENRRLVGVKEGSAVSTRYVRSGPFPASIAPGPRQAGSNHIVVLNAYHSQRIHLGGPVFSRTSHSWKIWTPRLY